MDACSNLFKLVLVFCFAEQALSRPKSLIKVKGSPQVDGADEKMLAADEEVIPEVVIFSNDARSPQNGDAKMDFGKCIFLPCRLCNWT